ncbi:hypothetical protein Vafri_7179 [Volvox africanus]|nr:hypothetical protein Vafri_7179 [Volvox africanus]
MQAMKPVGSVLSSCDGPAETSCENDLVPAAPGTPAEPAPSSRDLTMSQSVSDSGQQGIAGSGGGAGASGRAAHQLSPPPPRTPQQAASLSAISAGPSQPSVEKSAVAQPPPGSWLPAKVYRVLKRCSGVVDAYLHGSDPCDQRRPAVPLDSNSAGVSIDSVRYAPNHSYPFASTYKSIDRVSFDYDLELRQSPYVNYEKFQEQLVLSKQLHKQQIHQQQMRWLYTHQLNQQRIHDKQVRAQQRLQSSLPNQSRPPTTPTLPPTSTMHRPAEPLKPPQRPRPCPAFGPDLKNIKAVLECTLTSLFRKEPNLFRDVYGFELDWWIDARGRPLDDEGGDLLAAMLFHNFAAVVVRVDRCAAPAWAGHPQLLNPTVSALLNDKVYGNALLLRVFKLDGTADDAVNSVLGGRGALLVFPLMPAQCHTYVQESDNVAWQMDCYKNLAPGLVESLATDERATWLSRLPLAPLDKQGNPDLREALAMITTVFRIRKPGAWTRLKGCSEARQQLPEGCDSAGAVTSLECQKGGPEAAAEEELGAGVPEEVAPLLRALRCTSPWCTRIRCREPTTQHYRTRSCPLGHFIRDLDLRERSNTLQLVFDAARHCGSNPLVPELCPALVDRLSQLKSNVALPGKGDAIQDLDRQTTRNGSSSHNFTADANDSIEEDLEADVENVEEFDEEAAAPKSSVEATRLRPEEDLTFYMSFCRDGPRCRRCHSNYELDLAVALRRLNACDKVSSSGVAAPDQGQRMTRRRPRRRGFEVLATLSEAELNGHDEDRKDHSSKLVGDAAHIDTSGADDAHYAAGGRMSSAAPQSGPLPSAEVATVTAAATADAAIGAYGASFNWADEVEAAETSQEAAAPQSLAPQHRPPLAQSWVPAASGQQRGLPLSTNEPQLLLPPPPPPGRGTRTEWSSRAPMCCHTVGESTAVERSLRSDLPPLPRLPDTLDLEPLEAIPGRVAVAPSMAAKSRNGIYVPPHLRTPIDTEAEQAEQVAVPQVGESPLEEPQDTVEAQGTPAINDGPRSPSHMAPQGMAEQETEAFAIACSQGQARQDVAPGPNSGKDCSFDSLRVPPGFSPLSKPVTSQVLPSATPPAPMHKMTEQQQVETYRAQSPAQPPVPAGFYQDQERAAQPPTQVFPIPNPIPVPVPVAQHTSAQMLGVSDGPHLPSSSAVPRPLDTSCNFAHTPTKPHPIEDERSSTDIDDMFNECMSLCGIPLEEAPQRPPHTTAVQSNQMNDHMFVNAVFGGSRASHTRLGVSNMEAAAPLPAAPYALPHLPERPEFQRFPQPFASVPVDAEQSASTMQPPPMFADPFPASPFAQPNGLQSTHWLQPQHPYAPPGFVPCPFGAGAPFYGMTAVGVPQTIFQAHQPPPIPHGGLSPVGAYAPALDAFAGNSTGAP